jgi:hypothetical protein
MALLDELKLQGNVYNILDLLRKDVQCCKVVAVSWANSSIITAGVFLTIDQKGVVTVYDATGGSVLTPADYGTLTKP